MKNRWYTLIIFFLIFGFPHETIASKDTVIEWAMYGSWQLLSDKEGEPTIYGKGALTRFMIGQIDPHGDTALKWATDEAQTMVDRGHMVIQYPKETLMGNRTWYEIRSEVKMKFGPMIFVQWYSQNGTNLIEATLAGPQEEVSDNIENIEKTLTSLEAIQGQPRTFAGAAEFVAVWRTARLSNFNETAALKKDDIFKELWAAQSTKSEDLKITKGEFKSGYMLISVDSPLFVNGLKAGDVISGEEQMLYTKNKPLSDGTQIYGGQATHFNYKIKEAKYIGEGSINITSMPTPAKFFEVVVEVH